MIRPGCKVKIEDIGPLATVLAVARGKLELELEGDRFWIATRLCRAAER